MGILKKIQQAAKQAQQEIEEKTSDKLMEEELDPYGREHKGQPPGAPKKDKK